MKVDRKVLSSALDEIGGAVKLRDGQAVLFRPGRLIATDYSVTLSVPIDCDLDCALPFIQLRTFVKATTADQVTLAVETTKVRVTIGRARLTLNVMPNDVALPLPGVVSGSVALTGTDLKRLVDLTAYATTNDRIQFAGASWFTEDGYLFSAATDTKRLAEMRVIVKGAIKQVVVPRAGMDALSRVFANSAEVRVEHASNLLIARADGRVMHVGLLDSDFPRYRQLFSMKGKEKVKVGKDAFLAALRAIGAAVGTLPRVKLAIGTGGMRVSAVKEDIGDGFDDVEVEYEGNGVEVYLNYHYLVEMLTRLPTPELYLWADERLGKPVFVEPVGEDSLAVMIAPMVAD